MKILILLPLLKNTGPGNVVLSLLNSPEYQNHDIVLCSFLGSEKLFVNGISHKRTKIIALPGFSIKSLIELRKVIKTEKVDILHSHCLLPDIAAPIATLFTTCKSISTIHCDLRTVYNNEYPFSKANLYYFIHNMFMAFINKRISVSFSVKETLLFKSKVIYNGVKPRIISNKESENINLVFAGRLVKEKNILFLLTAIQSIQKVDKKNIVLHLYGDGELFDEINKFASPTIITHGFSDDFIAQTPKNSIFINPSFAEGMPMAVLEAIASGIPAVLSNIPPHKEIKDNINNGVELFELNQQSLLAAINRITNNTEFVSINHEVMAQDFNNCFSNEKMAKGYINEYKNTLT